MQSTHYYGVCISKLYSNLVFKFLYVSTPSWNRYKNIKTTLRPMNFKSEVLELFTPVTQRNYNSSRRQKLLPAPFFFLNYSLRNGGRELKATLFCRRPGCVFTIPTQMQTSGDYVQYGNITYRCNNAECFFLFFKFTCTDLHMYYAVIY